MPKPREIAEVVALRIFLFQIVVVAKQLVILRKKKAEIFVGGLDSQKLTFGKILVRLDIGRRDNVALFEYHDEPLAESSKLDWKVDGKEIHRRFKTLQWIINNEEWIMFTKKWKKTENIWYIMWFEWDETDPVIIVRPWLHAPEIDEYDQIKLKNIKWNFSDTENLDIWCKIQYKK